MRNTTCSTVALGWSIIIIQGPVWSRGLKIPSCSSKKNGKSAIKKTRARGVHQSMHCSQKPCTKAPGHRSLFLEHPVEKSHGSLRQIQQVCHYKPSAREVVPIYPSVIVTLGYDASKEDRTAIYTVLSLSLSSPLSPQPSLSFSLPLPLSLHSLTT